MNIELIPAIDLIAGRCVRLQQGDYARQTRYDADPLELALRLQAAGLRRLHMVDLDGARLRRVANVETLRRVAAGTRLTIDYGGGVKSEQDLQAVLDAGARKVTVGSMAVKRPDEFASWIETYGADTFILGADARDGLVSTDGWMEQSGVTLTAFIRHYYRLGLRQVLCTDIARDGMMQGPAVELYRQLLSEFPDLHLIASGGVRHKGDIEALAAAGVPAVVFGKALLEGKITIEELCSLNASSPA